MVGGLGRGQVRACPADDPAAQDRREVALPVELPPITETAWSHPSRQLGPGHRWLLDVLLAESAELPQPGAVPSR